MKTSTCSCGKAATTTVIVPTRVMAEHRTEERPMHFCPNCANAMIINGLGKPVQKAPPAKQAHDQYAHLRRGLEKAQAKCDFWAEKRMALPAGSSRAKVTTANAEWMRACELRDKFARALYDLTGEPDIA